MAWDYNPKDAVECLPEGAYDAELSSVTEKISKAGNPMLEVHWGVPRQDRVFLVRDFIVQPSGLFKLKQIARVWGLLDEFEAGTFDLAAHINRPIQLYLTIRSQENYPDSNNVASYREATFEPEALHVPDPATKDDEIPF